MKNRVRVSRQEQDNIALFAVGSVGTEVVQFVADDDRARVWCACALFLSSSLFCLRVRRWG